MMLPGGVMKPLAGLGATGMGMRGRLRGAGVSALSGVLVLISNAPDNRRLDG
jgi:uncharacterized membrane protein YccC